MSYFGTDGIDLGRSRKKVKCKYGKLKHPHGKRVCRKRRPGRRRRK
jgi:hypothetical protein